MQVAIRNLTKIRRPRVAFGAYKKSVLGNSYDLSLAFVTPREARALNRRYRGKTYAPNILSFPLSKNTGEIVICPKVAIGQARAERVSYARFAERLFIHGLLHLKGRSHGTKMTSAERRLAKRAGGRG